MKQLRWRWLVFFLCVFLACLNFKPSDPYLSEFLMCNKETELDYCSGYQNDNSCTGNAPCQWVYTSQKCSVMSCSDVALDSCGINDYNYCETSHNTCVESKCYKRFSEDEVNNDIYPWSTYAYFPFLLLLGPFAELCSYSLAILIGLCGRIATRFLLIYGNSLLDMRLAQVTYSLGTVAEDVFAAYIYYVVPPSMYQSTTSYVKASALIACVVSGIGADLLVVYWDESLLLLMWISAAFVCAGFVIGLFVLQAPIYKDVYVREVRHKQSSVSSNNEEVLEVVTNDDLINLLAPNNQHDAATHTVSDCNVTEQGHTKSTTQQGNIPSTYSPLAKHDTQGSLSQFSSPFDHNRSYYASSINNSSRKIATNKNVDSKKYGGHSSKKVKQSFSSVGSTSTIDEGMSVFERLKASFVTNNKNISDGMRRRSRDAGRSQSSRNTRQHMSKMQLFRQQMTFLLAVLKNNSILFMLLLWIVGNAVYTILYNYEVSIYEELHGSNGWNGSVLAAMLLMGSVGALVPTWLHHDKQESTTTAEDVRDDESPSPHIDSVTLTSPVSDNVVAIRLCIACILSSITLVFFVGAWKTIPSVSCLALFFGTWQYVNVTVYARLAMQLKLVQLVANAKQRAGGDHKDSVYSVFSHVTSTSGRDVTISNEASKSSSNFQRERQDESVTVSRGVDDEPYLRTHSSDYDLVDTSNAYHTRVHSKSVADPIVSILYRTNDEQRQHEVVKSPVHSPSVISPTLRIDVSADVNYHEEEEDNDEEEVRNNNKNDVYIAEPPYSIAIVSIIAMNVLVQIIIQVILFTWLQLELRNACVILVLIFCVWTLLYMLYAIICCSCDNSRSQFSSNTMYTSLIGVER